MRWVSVTLLSLGLLGAEYRWVDEPTAGETLAERIPPPAGFSRLPAAERSFGAWLRGLPVQPGRPAVRLHDGTRKLDQLAHHLVIDIDVGPRDLQQCADAVIRLRAEYLLARGCGDAIAFDFTSGDPARWSEWQAGGRPRVRDNEVTWSRVAPPDSSYASFRRYLDSVFLYAGSASLSRELEKVARPSQVEIGDVYIQAGFPGHAVLVVDVSVSPEGERAFLLAQSYMPAQDVHVLRSPRLCSAPPPPRSYASGSRATHGTTPSRGGTREGDMGPRDWFACLLVVCWSPVAVAQSVPFAPSWGSDRRLTFDPALSDLTFNFKRSLVAGPDGSVHAVWHDDRDGRQQIWYRRSLDRGVTYEGEIRLSEGPGTAEHASIALEDQRVYVVWHERHADGLQVRLVRSLDGGHSWEHPARLTASGRASHPSVAVSGPRVHVVWGDTRHGDAEVYTRRSLDGGRTWQPAIRISSRPYASWVPTVAAWGPDVYVAWVDYRDANEEEYLRVSRDGGATWGRIRRLTFDPADSWAPSLAARGRFVYLVWFDRRDAGLLDAEVEAVLDRAMALLGLPLHPAPPRNPAVYYLPPFQERVQHKLAAIQGAAPGWVAAGNDPASLEALMQLFANRMEAWRRGFSIYFTRSPNRGRSWSAPLRISTPGGPAARPRLDVAGSRLHVVWHDGRHGQSEIYYRGSPDRGAHFGPEMRLTRAAGESLRPSVAATADDVHVLWFFNDTATTEIYTKRNRPPYTPSPSR
jgi:hypothetical protein